MVKRPEKYGRYYWCVKSDLSQDKDIYLYADIVSVNKNGDLIFSKIKENDEHHIRMCFAKGHWKAFYAASVMDGSPVAVEYWKGEVIDGV